MSSTPRRWKYRIRHILDGITACQTYVSGMTEEQLGEDRRTLHAVAWELMMIEIIKFSIVNPADVNNTSCHVCQILIARLTPLD